MTPDRTCRTMRSQRSASAPALGSSIADRSTPPSFRAVREGDVVTIGGRRWHAVFSRGAVLAPFLTQGYEGFNVDDEEDWQRAESLVSSGLASLPSVDEAGWS